MYSSLVADTHPCSSEYGDNVGNLLPCEERGEGLAETTKNSAGHRGGSLLLCETIFLNILGNFYLQHQILTVAVLEVISNYCCGK